MNSLKKHPFFLFLLVIFFVFHGYVANFDFVPVKDALILGFTLCIVACVLAFIAWLFYRDSMKASIIAFAILGYHFFFGSIYDTFKSWFGHTFIIRYSFIIPASLILLIALIIFLKRKKEIPQKNIYYLNLLFVILIMVDTGMLLFKPTIRENKNLLAKTGFAKSNVEAKPDIYFIITDGYSGSSVLKNNFGFDNSGFEQRLRGLGFQIIEDSKSNYNFTPFSLASILNMQYLEKEKIRQGTDNLLYCYRKIKDNVVTEFLQSEGYHIYNHSIFDLKTSPAASAEGMLPISTQLITKQTFISRIERDLAIEDYMAKKWGIKMLQKKALYANQRINSEMPLRTVSIAATPATQPKFVYTHIFMPHYPYYRDSRGNPFPEDSLLQLSFITNKNHYTQYLQYCNTRIIHFVENIIKSSATPPVILLIGDHGFRYFQKNERDLCFYNLSAVLLPSRNYSPFYKGMSAVNIFPAVLNSTLGQHLPLQKDSTIYLW